MVGSGVAGVGAEVFERPSECHTRQPILQVNPSSGLKFWNMPLRRPLPELKLKYPECVRGLRVFTCSDGASLWCEYVSQEEIDEPTARDAQSRGGWPDTGYGFYSFKAMRLADGSYVAVWKCGASCE